MLNDEFFTVSEVATISGLSIQRVNQLIRAERITGAFKKWGVWHIPRNFTIEQGRRKTPYILDKPGRASLPKAPGSCPCCGEFGSHQVRNAYTGVTYIGCSGLRGTCNMPIDQRTPIEDTTVNQPEPKPAKGTCPLCGEVEGVITSLDAKGATKCVCGNCAHIWLSL